MFTGNKFYPELSWLFVLVDVYSWFASLLYFQLFCLPALLSYNTFLVLLMIQGFFPQNIAPGTRGVMCVVAAGQWAGADKVIIWLVLTPAGILCLWMKRPLWTVKNLLGMLKTHPRHEEPREGRPLQKQRQPISLPDQSWQSSCSVRVLSKRWPLGHCECWWTHTGYLHTVGSSTWECEPNVWKGILAAGFERLM